MTGKITIDKDRNAVKPAVVLEVKDGKLVYRETITPVGRIRSLASNGNISFNNSSTVSPRAAPMR